MIPTRAGSRREARPPCSWSWRPAGADDLGFSRSVPVEERSPLQVRKAPIRQRRRPGYGRTGPSPSASTFVGIHEGSGKITHVELQSGSPTWSSSRSRSAGEHQARASHCRGAAVRGAGNRYANSPSARPQGRTARTISRLSDAAQVSN